MGFDVLYLPPIHPIGVTERKGKNNSLTPGADDLGSPWAIGSVEGGHKSIHPRLGTLEDLKYLQSQARELGLEVVLDIAYQCSPDHPYVKEHREWFRERADGTVQYAENPPKKYQDIYPFDFESKDWRGLWAELKSVFEFWIQHGVTIFRVDNPHTKSFAFWEWCIGELKAKHPELIFLSEAFTRPRVMHKLAKLGFTQSYTYFTWRTTRYELQEYFTELTQEPSREYFRPNVWPNTPDILHEYLQHGGRPAFVVRAVLAATLAANYGMYGPAFELMEHTPREPGSEEYLNSEKYEIKRWERELPDSPLWYKDAVIYQLHVKAFLDSNGDGIGDFQGLTSKLDYIKELGVNAVWLLPFYPSPLKDDGYDVADYRNVHKHYGTREDFRAFVAEAHARGLKVITELVINHTSDQHPWFQAARRAPAGSKKRNYYVWSDSDQKYKGTRVIFTDTEASNWTWDPVAKQYYWHRYFSHQPDLNFENPHDNRAFLKVLQSSAAMGVDGFRLDAIPYLCEREGTNNENLPETHVVLKQIRAHMDARYQNRMLLAEANQWPEDVRPYFGDADECHMAFHFPLMPRMYMAIAQEDRHPVVEIMQQTTDIPPLCQGAIFLRNHDELTLEMVTST